MERLNDETPSISMDGDYEIDPTNASMDSSLIQAPSHLYGHVEALKMGNKAKCRIQSETMKHFNITDKDLEALNRHEKDLDFLQLNILKLTKKPAADEANPKCIKVSQKVQELCSKYHRRELKTKLVQQNMA